MACNCWNIYFFLFSTSLYSSIIYLAFVWHVYRGMDTLEAMAMLSKCFCLVCQQGYILKGKSISFIEYPFSDRVWGTGKQRGSHTRCPPQKKWPKILSNGSIPLKRKNVLLQLLLKHLNRLKKGIKQAFYKPQSADQILYLSYSCVNLFSLPWSFILAFGGFN